jgi:cytochrome c biogenesis factor
MVICLHSASGSRRPSLSHWALVLPGLALVLVLLALVLVLLGLALVLVLLGLALVLVLLGLALVLVLPGGTGLSLTGWSSLRCSSHRPHPPQGVMRRGTALRRGMQACILLTVVSLVVLPVASPATSRAARQGSEPEAGACTPPVKTAAQRPC